MNGSTFLNKNILSHKISLALKLYSAKGRDRNGIGGFPAHCALALRAATYPEKQRPFLINNSLVKMLVFSCLGRALDGKVQSQ